MDADNVCKQDGQWLAMLCYKRGSHASNRGEWGSYDCWTSTQSLSIFSTLSLSVEIMTSRRPILEHFYFQQNGLNFGEFQTFRHLLRRVHAQEILFIEKLRDEIGWTLRAPAVMKQSTDVKFFGRPFVKRFALCYQIVVCLSVLSVTLVYCGQTVGWMKMKLGMQVVLGSGHIVLDGDPASLPNGAQPLPNFRPMSIVVKRLDGSRCHLVRRYA